MFGLDVKIENDFQRVAKAETRAEERILKHRADAVAKTAQDSIVTSDAPSMPGRPPHTRGKSGQNLPEAIQADVTNGEALIGPSADVIGELGAAFEFGGDFHGDEMDERPFMLPALEANLDPFLNDFDGAIGD